jgi:hypothetical protein
MHPSLANVARGNDSQGFVPLGELSRLAELEALDLIFLNPRRHCQFLPSAA